MYSGEFSERWSDFEFGESLSADAGGLISTDLSGYSSSGELFPTNNSSESCYEQEVENLLVSCICALLRKFPNNVNWEKCFHIS